MSSAWLLAAADLRSLADTDAVAKQQTPDMTVNHTNRDLIKLFSIMFSFLPARRTLFSPPLTNVTVYAPSHDRTRSRSHARMGNPSINEVTRNYKQLWLHVLLNRPNRGALPLAR